MLLQFCGDGVLFYIASHIVIVIVFVMMALCFILLDIYCYSPCDDGVVFYIARNICFCSFCILLQLCNDGAVVYVARRTCITVRRNLLWSLMNVAEVNAGKK